MTKDSVARQVTALERLSLSELRDRWRELMGGEPPSYRRRMLIRHLAYRIQELAYGGLSAETRKRLAERLPEAERITSDRGKVAPLMRRAEKNSLPVVGTRLVRYWNDQRYEVTVVAGGSEFEGRPYRSLSAIARQITGTRWNGPAFFGLRKTADKRSTG